MPEESKNNQQKKNDPKEQRKGRRQARHQNVPTENKVEKKATENKVEKKVENKVIQPEKPVYEEPGPEFYKNLKRETDEILKITEEANSKYKKKEIKSNWTKYEMPIESYEEIEEQESMGADYEKLIQAPLSIGGHFQFKHEKSWSTEIEPSLYDKYFEINMNNLATALSTIPFYERNNIDQNLFNETDILSMKNRSTKYKQKYYNDKTYTTPELESQEKILNTLKENLIKPEENIQDKVFDENTKSETIRIGNEEKIPTEISNTLKENLIKPEEKIQDKVFDNETKLETIRIGNEEKIPAVKKELVEQTKQNLESEEIRFNLNNTELEVNNKIELTSNVNISSNNNVDKGIDDNMDILLDKVESKSSNLPTKEPTVEVKKVKTTAEDIKVTSLVDKKTPTVAEKVNPATKTKNPVIESPEDLEKWLDDFLDG